jgi:UDP-GlcNAc3NAcA epimerase
MKIATIIGARPQFIKAAVVSRAISEFNKRVTANSSRITEVIVHTGQHYDRNMSDVFFEEMDIPKPDYFLDINGLSHGAMTGQMLEKIEDVLEKEKPDIVLVYGDTNTTLAGALAAVKLHIPVAHVEAGLRSFNRKMPEEINRLVTDHVASILFCPTEQAVRNLNAEGIGTASNQVFGKRSRLYKTKKGLGKEQTVKLLSIHELSNIENQSSISSSTMRHGLLQNIEMVGDVMYDSVLYYSQLAEKNSQIIGNLKLTPKGFGLATVHRAENTDNTQRLESIFLALDKISSKGLPIIVPLHPRTRKKLATVGVNLINVQLIDPVSYFDMLLLEKQAKVILTDSGGVQKEAFWLKVPCITLRDETEWVELVENGTNYLAGTKTQAIYNTYKNAVEKRHYFALELYGDGKAGERIVDFLITCK